MTDADAPMTEPSTPTYGAAQGQDIVMQGLDSIPPPPSLVFGSSSSSLTEFEIDTPTGNEYGVRNPGTDVDGDNDDGGSIIMQDRDSNPPPSDISSPSSSSLTALEIDPPTEYEHSARDMSLTFDNDGVDSGTTSGVSVENQVQTPTEVHSREEEETHGGGDDANDTNGKNSSTPPTPPIHLFRTIRQLNSINGMATWLCLPRRLIDIPDRTSYNARMYPFNLARALRKAVSSQIKNELDAEHMTQLVIVKTSADPALLREQATLLERLHKPADTQSAAATGPVRFYTQSFVGSYLVRQQLTGEPQSSWLCLRPHFGRPLMEFGWWSYQHGMLPLPAWFVWHIFLSMLSALGIVHGRGIANNNVCLQNILLNPHPVHGVNEFRNWPDVVLADFNHGTTLDDESARNDVQGLLQVIRHIIDVYTTTHNPTRQGVHEQVDHLALFSSYVDQIVDANQHEDLNLAAVKTRWEDIAVLERDKGPTRFPEEFMTYASNQLIDADGLGRARALTFKFGDKVESFRALARARPERTPVVFEKKSETTADGKEIIRALCTVKFLKKKHLLEDVELIRGYLQKRYEAKSEYDTDMNG